MNIIESVSRLNPPLCAITGCRYLSRPLKRRSQRIGKIRLWLNRIKRGKFTFGNSKSERVEAFEPRRTCNTPLHLPPFTASLSLSLSLYSILSQLRFRETEFLSVPPRSARYRSARTVYNADAAVFETVYTPTDEYSVHRVLFPNPCTDSGTRRVDIEGWRKCISRAPARYFCRVTLFRSWEKDRSISPSGTCFRMVKFSYTFENRRDN